MLPTSMKAVVTTGHGGMDKLEYRDVPVPAPADDEVLIEVSACGLNNTDIWLRTGAYGTDRDPDAITGTGRVPHRFPLIQGADVVGRIVSAGAGVDEKRIGERVICAHTMYREGPRGLEVAGSLGNSRPGGYAQYTAVPSSNAYRIDSPHTDAELATLPCAYLTAENMLETAGLESGETVLVTGASGGVGTALIQLAHARGARVVAVTSEAKMEAVRTLSPHAVVDRSAGDLVDAVGRELEDPQVDVVADVVAGPHFRDCLELLRGHGRYVSGGAIGGGVVEFDVRTLYLKYLTFYGVSGGMPWHFERVLEHLREGKLEPLLHATYPLAEIEQAQCHFVSKSFFGNLAVLPGPA